MWMSEEIEKQMEEWDPEKLRKKTHKLKFPVDLAAEGIEEEIPDNLQMGEPKMKPAVPKPVRKKDVGKKKGKSNKLF
jgi:hypothetical protein